MDMQAINARTIEQFRAGGPIEGMQRARLLLLTTVGRTTGRPRTAPMMFHRDGERVLVIASNAGAHQHPDWYLNLVANPRVTVELDDETFPALATPLEGDERSRVWAVLTELYPFFADHQAGVDRTIPVVALARAGSGASHPG
jgi:deazaflavin-dependent oxidoreductase (nitroreductase family)